MERSGMHPAAEVNAAAAAAAADRPVAYPATAAPTPAPAAPASLGRLSEETGNNRDCQHGRNCDDKPPQHGRLPRLHLAPPQVK